MEYLKILARKFRQQQTLPEQIMWNILRKRRFAGLKFRRQVPIDKYIADFVCYEKRIIIELDGSEHLESENIIKDEIRTEKLESLGFKVLRFYNTDILNNIETVLAFLYKELNN